MTPSISTETRSVTQSSSACRGGEPSRHNASVWRQTSAAARCANASFRCLESRLYPLVALDSVGGRDSRCREALDIGDGDLAADVLGHAIRGALHGLMALAQRHVDLASRRLETQILERRDDLLLARPLAVIRSLRLFVRGLHAQNRLGHFVCRVARSYGIAVFVRLAEPLVQLRIRRKHVERPASADNRAFGDLRTQPDQRGLAGGHDDSAFLEQAPWRALQDQRFGVTAPKARVDDVRTAG